MLHFSLRVRSLVGALFAGLLASPLLELGSSPIRAAEPITLQSKDGSATITGTLETFDGQHYAINIPSIGPMKVDVQKFNCVSADCPKLADRFGIHGSNTIGAQLMPALIEAHARSIGGNAKIIGGLVPEELEVQVTNGDGTKLASIALQSHGSGTAAPGLASGQAMIGMMSRPIKDAEAKTLADAGFGDMRDVGREHVLGLDALLVLVAPGNPVNALTTKQIAEIFAGEITDWASVGRSPGKINIYSRDFKSGTYDTFASLVLSPNKKKIADHAKLFESTPDLADEVANDPNGIGFVGFAYQRNAKALSVTNECGMTITSEIFNVKTEEYPLSRRLFLYTGALKNDAFPARLLDYALSPKAQGVLQQAGFVDQGIKMLPKLEQISRLANLSLADGATNSKTIVALASELKSSYRLSTTFRFRFGSSTLDNKALQDITVLAEFFAFMESKQPKSRPLLVGFSDGVGSYQSNLQLSLGRAQAIRDRLLAAVGRDSAQALVDVRGYGSTLPVACDSSDEGRAKNRRVEVWLR